MKPEILTNPGDDPQFAELVNRLTAALVNASSPEQVFMMRIDNWFDHKCLSFSGIDNTAASSRMNSADSARDESTHHQKIFFPPFTVNRLTGEYYFVRDENGDYSPSASAPYLHQRKPAHSSETIHKQVTEFSDSAIFVWFSSNTESNSRGSIMIYELKDSIVHGWYAGLSKSRDWRVLQTRGITRDEVRSLLTAAPQLAAS
jgi:hypothetical protein